MRFIIAAQEYFSGDVKEKDWEDGAVEVVSERRKNKQAKRKVTQRARAWKYFLGRFCIEEEELSINLLQNTHMVLCAGYETEDSKEERWERAGVFRDVDTFVTTCASKYSTQKTTR